MSFTLYFLLCPWPFPIKFWRDVRGNISRHHHRSLHKQISWKKTCSSNLLESVQHETAWVFISFSTFFINCACVHLRRASSLKISFLCWESDPAIHLPLERMLISRNLFVVTFSCTWARVVVKRNEFRSRVHSLVVQEEVVIGLILEGKRFLKICSRAL